MSLIEDACRAIGAEIAVDPRYAHTSHLRVQVAGKTVFDEHYRGPLVADVFSVTKTVLATVCGIAARDRVADPAWRHLLTMTRGARIDDTDEVTALPSGQAARFAAAPREHPPGQVFQYDDGAFHLLSAHLADALGTSVADYAATRLFRPLGIEDAVWPADPDGVTYGFAHLRLSAASLGRLAEEWRRPSLMDPAFAAAMMRAHTPGGPPEGLPYGYGVWVGDGYVMAGGWAGQHVLVLPGAVVVTTGDPGFTLGPPPRDELPSDWRPALDLIRRHLLPLL